MKNSVVFNSILVSLQMRAKAWLWNMQIDTCHWFVLIRMIIYVEYLIYTPVYNQNIYLGGHKSVELIKKFNIYMLL